MKLGSTFSLLLALFTPKVAAFQSKIATPLSVQSVRYRSTHLRQLDRETTASQPRSRPNCTVQPRSGTCPLLYNRNTMSRKPSKEKANALRAAFLVYSLGVGYYAATRPVGQWKNPFSWHPFLMTVGMIGCMGVAAITKKLGGYTNTKHHGLIADLGVLLAGGGFYAIYRNKNLLGKDHFTTTHGQMGLLVFISCIGLGLVGGIALHPDFGVDKTNKTIRYAHKMGARVILAMSWVTAFYGFYSVTKDLVELAIFAVPLLILAPMTLV